MSLLLVLVQKGDAVQMHAVSAGTREVAKCEASLHDAMTMLQQSNASIVEVIARVSDTTFRDKLHAWVRARNVKVADYKTDAHESASEVCERYLRTLRLEVDPVSIPMRNLLWVEAP